MVPPEFLTPEDEELGVVNQEFLDWEQQDQLLLSWLLSSRSNNMLTRVVGCHTLCKHIVRDSSMISFIYIYIVFIYLCETAHLLS